MTWSISGLCYDIVGAIALAFALFFNSPIKIAHQSATQWNSNKYASRALAGQTVDARFGAILLVTGFVLQIVGQLDSTSGTWPMVSLVILMLVVIGFLVARPSAVDRLVAKVENAREAAKQGQS